MKKRKVECPYCFTKGAVEIQWGPSLTNGIKTITIIVSACTSCHKTIDIDAEFKKMDSYQAQDKTTGIKND